MTWTIIVLVVLALVLWSFYISWRASRLDRLHNRVEAARTALDLALVRRASAASDLALSGLLDPATSILLADAVRRVRQADTVDRDLAESDLTRALRATVGDPELRGELRAADAHLALRANGNAAPDAPDAAVFPSTAGTPDAPAGPDKAGIPDTASIPDSPIIPDTRVIPDMANIPDKAGKSDDGGLDPDDPAELLDEVERAAQQVFIARKFYNDVAGRTIYARSRPLARVLRLSGSARQPEFFEMDDALTDGEG
jgi:hypothetical protein